MLLWTPSALRAVVLPCAATAAGALGLHSVSTAPSEPGGEGVPAATGWKGKDLGIIRRTETPRIL